MYLSCYYLGSSILGYASGMVFHGAGWPGLVAWLTALSGLGVAVAAYVVRRASPPTF